MYVIGVDVGGTKIKCGLIKDYRLVARVEEGTNTFDIIRQIENIIKRIMIENGLVNSDIKGVGVGFPGIVVNGYVCESANVGIKDCNLSELLSTDLGMNVKVLNDGNLAALAEHKLGAGVGSENIILLTIGTGVGGGIIANNQLYEGNGGGELGHITFEKNGLECNCGRRGCVDKYLSYTSLLDRLKKHFASTKRKDKELSPNEILSLYKDGDEEIKKVFAEYIDDFSEGILNYCNIFRPDKIIIGGGLSYIDDIIDRVAKKCKEKEYGYKNSPPVEIMSALLKNDAGVIGASVLFE